MLKIIRAVIEFFSDYSPEREARKRLTQAKLDLVENECALEYYGASVPMLKARIARIEADLASPAEQTNKVEIRIQRPTPMQAPAPAMPDMHPGFSFRRQGAEL